MREQDKHPTEREELFRKAEHELRGLAQVYRLEDRFEGLEPELASITMLDVTQIPGCHYGLKNVFVPIIYNLENRRMPGESRVVVSPQTAILVEPSMGNGWVAFSDASEMLGYEHVVVMPDGLPEPRYKHPQGREVKIIRTPKEEFVLGMPKQLKALMDQNRQRLREGKKIYVSPNHAVGSADITAETMAEAGRQLLQHIRESGEPIRMVVTMGNGSSIYAVGDYVKKHTKGAKVVVTESFAYGGGYDQFARRNQVPLYRDSFGIDPGDPRLMATFSAYGSNAPIGIDLPLQKRAIEGDLVNEYMLFADQKVLQAFKDIRPSEDKLRNALALPNYSLLPQALIETYGNTTLANIAVARRLSGKGERFVAMAYDSRKNY